MRKPPSPLEANPNIPRFYNVSQVARMFQMSAMTVYRAIQDGQFPAIRIRDRLSIPAKAIDDMVETAIRDSRLVDAREWVQAEEVAGVQL